MFRAVLSSVTYPSLFYRIRISKSYARNCEFSTIEEQYSFRNYTYEAALTQKAASVPFLYPLKTSENLRVFYVFRGYRSGTLVKNLFRFEKVISYLVYGQCSRHIETSELICNWARSYYGENNRGGCGNIPTTFYPTLT